MTGTLGRIGSPAVLWAGVVAPLLFTGVHVVEGATRPRYDPCRHQVSLLSLGPGGWVQVATFLVTGILLTPHRDGCPRRAGGSMAGAGFVLGAS